MSYDLKSVEKQLDTQESHIQLLESHNDDLYNEKHGLLAQFEIAQESNSILREKMELAEQNLQSAESQLAEVRFTQDETKIQLEDIQCRF